MPFLPLEIVDYVFPLKINIRFYNFERNKEGKELFVVIKNY